MGRSVGQGEAELRWRVKRCLEFIEFRMFSEGHFNRMNVTQHLCIWVNEASLDLNRYIALAPDNMVYDKRASTYVRGRDFDCEYRAPETATYLAQLRLVADNVFQREDCWNLDLPPYAPTPTPVCGVEQEKLLSVVGTICPSGALKVKYRCLYSQDPRWRWIAPHPSAFLGFRWHIRAFCLSNECFKDFLLSRMIKIRGPRESETSADDDRDWHSEVTLEVGSHPDLSKTQAKVIALDYGMRGGKAKIKFRRALLYFALRRLGPDTDPSARRPQDHQIVLVNSEEVACSVVG